MKKILLALTLITAIMHAAPNMSLRPSHTVGLAATALTVGTIYAVALAKKIIVPDWLHTRWSKVVQMSSKASNGTTMSLTNDTVKYDI